MRCSELCRHASLQRCTLAENRDTINITIAAQLNLTKFHRPMILKLSTDAFFFFFLRTERFERSESTPFSLWLEIISVILKRQTHKTFHCSHGQLEQTRKKASVCFMEVQQQFQMMSPEIASKKSKCVERDQQNAAVSKQCAPLLLCVN